MENAVEADLVASAEEVVNGVAMATANAAEEEIVDLTDLTNKHHVATQAQ